MARVKLEKEQELRESQEELHRVFREFKQDPDLRGVQISEDNNSVFCFKKEEPKEVEIKAEPLEFPLARESVKSEESQTATEESRKDADGAGLSGKHGEKSSNTDDWTPSAPQTHSEGNREESAGDGCSSDSESSWEFHAPTKTPVRTKRKMEVYPDWTLEAETRSEVKAKAGAPAKRHTCSHCGKAFETVISLRVHEQNHKRVKSFPCSVCAKVFTRLDNLNIHMRRHTGETPFKCTVCEKSFIAKIYLSLHMRAHTGRRPFKCTECEKCFALKYVMRRHVKTHTGEKPFECSVCAKWFTTKSILNRHMKTHKGSLSEHVEFVQRILNQRVL